MQYITRYANGNVSQVADWNFPGSVPVNDDAVVCVKGCWYDADKAPVITPEQERAEQVAAERARLCAELDALDAKGARAARAVALAVAKGEQVNAADMEKLALIEEAAQALRAEMGAL